MHPRSRSDKAKILTYLNKHDGDRCFILGNGPSLNNTDLSLLQDEYSFGMNRIYLLFDDMGFFPSYYLAVNTLLIEQCAKDILALNLRKFISWRARGYLGDDPNVLFLNTDYTGPLSFTGDMTGRIYEGGTVTFVAMQLAYYMGFREVILVGVDHSFNCGGQPNTVVVSDGKDTDHFSTAYFPKGFRWQLPDLGTSREAYGLAKAAFDQDGRSILDGTIGGKLDVFRKIDLYNEI